MEGRKLKKILVITTHRHDEWDGGDSVITHGLFNLVPELRDCSLRFSKEIAEQDTEDAVQWCDYIIHAGTPSWHRIGNRRFWTAAIKFQKRLSMLGIGLTVPYNATMWYGAEAFVELRDSGLIDSIVCRDKLCNYWLQQRLGFDSTRITTLPCPGFFLLEPKTVEAKTKVVLSIADVERTSRESKYTFQGYYEKTKHLIDELIGCGAEVFVTYQRKLGVGFRDLLNQQLGELPIYTHASKHDFAAFCADKDVYIGVRNHGALPCAGSGMPSLLLGTDYRQSIADEIPFISKIDISHKWWEVREVSDWYRSVIPCSGQLLEFRRIVESRWREATEHLRGMLN